MHSWLTLLIGVLPESLILYYFVSFSNICFIQCVAKIKMAFNEYLWNGLMNVPQHFTIAGNGCYAE